MFIEIEDKDLRMLFDMMEEKGISEKLTVTQLTSVAMSYWEIIVRTEPSHANEIIQAMLPTFEKVPHN